MASRWYHNMLWFVSAFMVYATFTWYLSLYYHIVKWYIDDYAYMHDNLTQQPFKNQREPWLQDQVVCDITTGGWTMT